MNRADINIYSLALVDKVYADKEGMARASSTKKPHQLNFMHIANWCCKVAAVETFEVFACS